MNLYTVILYVHSYLRWAVVFGLVLVTIRSFVALGSRRGWESKDERWQRAAIGFVDLQFTLGLLLYVWLSPITTAFFAAPGSAMKDPVLRFFGVEHITMMLLGVSLVHVGKTRSSKAATPAQRHRTVARFTLAGLVLILAGVPWPFLKSARPLARGFGDAAPAPRAAPVASAGTCPPAFKTRCSTCHGEHGRGDGVAANALKPPPRDFTDPALQGRSDAVLARVIREGGAAHGLSVAMPAHSDLSEVEALELVRCVRSFASPR
jgi:mono/diheme cytochrome c family protein